MTRAAHFIQVGQVLKSNGTDGDVVLRLYDDIDCKEPVFIFFDELPVPFFVDVSAERGSSKVLAHLTDIDSLADAEEIVGRGIFIPEDEAVDDGWDDFTGWTIVAANPEAVAAAPEAVAAAPEVAAASEDVAAAPEAAAAPVAPEAVTVGTVTAFEDIPGNPCLEVQPADSGSEPFLIPLHEDLIEQVDEKKRILRMIIPKGLL